MLTQMQNYQRLSPSDVRVIAQEKDGPVETRLLVFQTPYGYRRMGELFLPQGDGPFAAILYVHWYERQSPDSNRSQFVNEARQMARAGAICLTIETLWSDPDFFLKRTQEDDMKNSVEEVANLRRALDFLITRPHVDANRFAFVGHDFGGMYGVLAGSLDKRPTHYVIMAATPRFPDWYLYRPKLEGVARETFIREFSEINPVAHVAELSPAPILFQFANRDPHVPELRAEEFFAAAKEPKESKFYRAGHGLNQKATQDRKAWLKKNLVL